MALIPRGDHQGRVVVWNMEPVIGQAIPFRPASEVWSYQAYAILDPLGMYPGGPRPTFRNYLLPMSLAIFGPTGNFGEDIFCAGHCWSNFGDLVVAGGTIWSNTLQQFTGKGTLVFSPMVTSGLFPATTTPIYPTVGGVVNGGWVRGPDLQAQTGRYYPTATLTSRYPSPRTPANNNTVVILGGSQVLGGPPGQNPTWNSYEALVVLGQANQFSSGVATDSVNGISLFPGPSPGAVASGPGVDDLFEYPRAHHMSNGEIFVSGFPPLSARLDHSTTTWNNQTTGRTVSGTATPSIRYYGSNVCFPGQGNIVVRTGGATQGPTGINGNSTPTTELCYADQTGPWFPAPTMVKSRTLHNAVTLPNGNVLVVGGQTVINGGVTNVHDAEMFSGGSWSLMASDPSPRDYHSSALLLPSGNVLVAGGNGRTIDYELYSPPYFTTGLAKPQNVDFGPVLPRPAFDSVDKVFNISYHQMLNLWCAPLPTGVFISKVVLMAPGSVTHHSDQSASYWELMPQLMAPNSLQCKTPTSETQLPRGIYMLWLVTNQGVPGQAIWVRLS